MIALSILAVCASVGLSAFIWISADDRYARAEALVERERLNVTIVQSDVRSRQLTEQLRQSIEDADEALGSFYSGHPYEARPSQPAVPSAVDTTDFDDARSELIGLKRGWPAVTPILTWGAAIYLGLLAALALCTWVLVGFPGRNAAASEGYLSDTSDKMSNNRWPSWKIVTALVGVIAALATVGLLGVTNFNLSKLNDPISAPHRTPPAPPPAAPRNETVSEEAATSLPPPSTPATTERPSDSAAPRAVNLAGEVFDAYLCLEASDAGIDPRLSCRHVESSSIWIDELQNEEVARVSLDGERLYVYQQRVLIDCRGRPSTIRTFWRESSQSYDFSECR